MAIAWPGSVPWKWLLDGYEPELEDNRLSFKPDAGPSIDRRNASARTDILRGAMIWTTSQKDDALDFYTDDLQDGVLPFEALHPESGVLRDFKFVTPLRYVPLSHVLWHVTFEVYVLP